MYIRDIEDTNKPESQLTILGTPSKKFTEPENNNIIFVALHTSIKKENVRPKEQ